MLCLLYVIICMCWKETEKEVARSEFFRTMSKSPTRRRSLAQFRVSEMCQACTLEESAYWVGYVLLGDPGVL